MNALDWTKIKFQCRVCGAPATLKVGGEDYARWQWGQVAQDAFPYLTPAEREWFISETCESCWDKMWEE